jgi:hypothetical protein
MATMLRPEIEYLIRVISSNRVFGRRVQKQSASAWIVNVDEQHCRN